MKDPQRSKAKVLRAQLRIWNSQVWFEQELLPIEHIESGYEQDSNYQQYKRIQEKVSVYEWTKGSNQSY